MYQLITTIGLEFEAETVTSSTMNNALGGSGVFKQTHDASIEADVTRNRTGIYIKMPRELDKNDGGRQKNVIGTEIITIPFDTESNNILLHLKELTRALMQYGEPEQSYRAGIHVHVNMSYNLKILKSIIKLGCYLEDVFFYIGTQGYTFRGMKVNDNSYCRPITKWGPQVVKVGRKNFQVFNVEDLLKAETMLEFWWRYGSLYVSGEERQGRDNYQRYAPQRYTWLNLYSLLVHSTLEFRVFNKTLSPFRINSEIKFCQSFCEFAMKQGFSSEINLPDLPINSVYDRRPKDEVLETFEQFCDLTAFPSEDRAILAKIIMSAPNVEFPNEYVWTHLEHERKWWGSSESDNTYLPEHSIPVDEIKTPDIIDIHALRGEGRPN